MKTVAPAGPMCAAGAERLRLRLRPCHGAACAKKGGIWAYAASAGTGTAPRVLPECVGKLRKVAAFLKNPGIIPQKFSKYQANSAKILSKISKSFNV